MFFGTLCQPKLIDWMVSSEKDPRWNKNGEFTGFVTAGYAEDALSHIEECKKKYGPMPNDLNYGCMKR